MLVKCVEIRSDKVLHIEGDILCYTWWQNAIEIFLGTCVVPVFLVLALGPYYVKKKQMSVTLFSISCVLPLPVACYFAMLQLCRKIAMVSLMAIGYPVDNDKSRKKLEYSKSEMLVIEHLLKHYKTLRICGISMTWLGFHKLFRMVLIWCNTYIMEPLPKLSAMSGLVLFMAFITIFTKPYKETTANTVAILSHAASICIAIMNVAKSALIAGVYDPNDLVRTVVQYLDFFENILLTWVPVGVTGVWLMYTVWQFARPKDKKSNDGVH